MFSEWSNVAITRVSLHFKPHSYKKGNIVYAEGDPAKYVYFVAEGAFRFIKTATIQPNQAAPPERLYTQS